MAALGVKAETKSDSTCRPPGGKTDTESDIVTPQPSPDQASSVDSPVVSSDVHTPGRASSIQAIDRASVHRICSGQVVLNLATAIKELVENSVDAGATNVEIRLKDYGSELVEVIDNGSGVQEENFEGLGLKHHTSKLQDFSDLVNVDTFGFRGEALSSLCALSKLTVTTCHKEAKIGSKIEYDHHGKMVKVTPSPRQTGTTVSLEQLFYTLPVRHKEFLRNLKKDFAKMAQVLNAYCLISTGVRISCTNQLGKGKKNIVVNTGGNDNLKENITNIFGAKQVQSLIPFKQISPDEELCSSFSIKVPDLDNSKLFCLQGFVSSSEHGSGRSSADRQYYFINKRPCDVLKLSKLVNEVYHMYNRHQYPFVLLDITLEKESVDVNVTPDKRMVFLQQERLLLATLKASLVHMFEPRASLYQVNRPSLGSAARSPLKKHASCPVSSPEKSLTSSLAGLKRSFSSAFSRESPSSAEKTPNRTIVQDSKQRKLDYFVRKPDELDISQSPLRLTPITQVTDLDSVSDSGTKTPPLTDSQTSSGVSSMGDGHQVASPLLTNYSSTEPSPPNFTSTNPTTTDPLPSEDLLKSNHGHKSGNLHISSDLYESGDLHQSEADDLMSGAVTVIRVNSSMEELAKEGEFQSNMECNTTTSECSPSSARTKGNSVLHRSRSSDDDEDTTPAGTSAQTEPEVKITFTEYDVGDRKMERKETRICFSMAGLKKRLSRRSASQEGGQVSRRGFRAQIRPGDSQAAEEELRKEISKDMFSKMEILGQFNLGFIIGKLGPDLFIIDQHATDEKYNFEMLQKHTVLQGQKLIRPQNLQLTAMNEIILLDNLEILKANGFEFQINEDAPCGERVSLTSMPVSKNWSFGKEDIEELIFMLTDSPGVMCRPSRIRQMFASRACRKSIMIGTALNQGEMRKLVNHMGDIEQPWNCPHGRPTMRHLVNLDMLSDGPLS